MKKSVIKTITKTLTLAAIAMGTLSLTACGEESTADYKVAIVKYVDDASLNQIEDAIVAELEAKGKELDVTFDIELYNGQADGTILTQIATEIVADEVDVVIPIATPAAVLLQSAIEDTDIKMVFSAVTDPVDAGLVKTADAPGGKITGVSDAVDTDAIMNLILVQNPDIKKLGLLYNKSEPSSIGAIEDAKAFCKEKGIEVVEKTGTNVNEIQTAADVMVAEKVEAIFTPQDNTVMQAELAIFEKFTDAKIAHYTSADSFALNGALLGYGINYIDLGTLTADMVIDVTVNKADPATTAVKTLADGIITVNTETAEALGIDTEIYKEHCNELRKTTTKKEF